jgi:hypothetical protein
MGFTAKRCVWALHEYRKWIGGDETLTGPRV